MKNQKLLNTKTVVMMALIAILIAAAMAGCSSAVGTGTNQGKGSEGGEASHSESGGEGSEGGAEESGNALTLDQTYDTVRNGARLIMSYDAQDNAFVGTVANTTNSTLPQVRVEVHLSNGIELGPTTPTDLAPGEKVVVRLPASSQSFDGWTAHPEVGGGEGGGEHGSGGEGGSEHGIGGEGAGEHGGDSD